MKQWLNTRDNYGVISQFLHWLMAFLFFLMFALAWGRSSMPGMWRAGAITLHKSLGVMLLILFCIRICWRLYSRPPVLPDTFSATTKLAAHTVHWLLYGMFLAMPFSGWLMVSAMGPALALVGGYSLPPLTEKAPDLVPLLKNIHNLMGWGFLMLIAAHIFAAVLHQFFYKDDILRRMLPLVRKSR